MGQPMGVEELLALPVSVDLVTAARAFRIGRTTAHELARAGKFPCRVIKVSGSYRVPRADLLTVLGVDPSPVPTAKPRIRASKPSRRADPASAA